MTERVGGVEKTGGTSFIDGPFDPDYGHVGEGQDFGLGEAYCGHMLSQREI